MKFTYILIKPNPASSEWQKKQADFENGNCTPEYSNFATGKTILALHLRKTIVALHLHLLDLSSELFFFTFFNTSWFNTLYHPTYNLLQNRSNYKLYVFCLEVFMCCAWAVKQENTSTMSGVGDNHHINQTVLLLLCC